MNGAAVLADFRAWLADALSRAPAEVPAPPSPPIDLNALLGHFVALRQEVNLQTRATRGQQEQNDRTLSRLEQALEALGQAQARAQQQQQQSQEELLRPLLTTLVDLYDSLALAGREVQRVCDSTLPLLAEVVVPLALVEAPAVPPAAPPVPPAAPARRSFWSRWFGGAPDGPGEERLARAEGLLLQAAARLEGVAQRRDEGQRQEGRQRAEDACDRVEQALASLVTGYTMGIQRIERALRRHGLEPIPTVGEGFDPERMEALEPVAGSGHPEGEVVEEVRRGYLWNGRVFRYAQVRVAKG